MNNNSNRLVPSALVAGLLALSSHSYASDFSELGQRLTPIGAEQAANAAGTIPAWTGGLATDAAPVKQHFLTDPYADDKPLFVITAQNYSQYAEHLTPGQIATFKRYPETYQMPIYETRRSVGFPQYVYDKVKATAGQGKLVNNGDGLDNFYFDYFAFPIPENGAQVLWNHKTRYRINVERSYVNASPLVNGAYTPVKMQEYSAYPQYIPGTNLEETKGIFAFIKQRAVSPSRLAGNVLLVHDTLNPLVMPRLAWTYSAGQRRVRRAPQVSYDSPDANADGLRTTDNFFLYSGSPDRYNWKLVGKKEIYIPYNSYKATSPELKYSDIVKPGHINPEVTRYELHRVWEVQGDLKEGQRHIYAQRNFFIDEDSWMIVLADHYDARGTLWRVGTGHLMQVYNKQIPAYGVETLNDLLAGRYTVTGMSNEETNASNYDYKPTPFDFTTASLRSSGVR